MIRKLSAVIAILAAASLTPNVASAEAIDFEDLSAVGQGGSFSNTRYAAAGLVLSNANSYAAYNHPAGGSNTPGYSFYNSSSVYGDIAGSFTSLMNGMSIMVGDWCCDFDVATLRVYDGSNNLLDTVAGSGTEWFTLSTNAAGIARFEIATSGAVLFDNLTFGDSNNQVPEPGALLLAGLALSLAGAARRRKS